MKASPVGQLVAFAGLSLAATGASADPAGDAALAAVDGASHRATTLYIEYRAVTNLRGKDPTELAFGVWTKGDRRLARLLAPADAKGIKMLASSPSDVYAFFPELRRVSRLTPALIHHGFLGMTFTPADFALASYSDFYAAALGGEDPERRTLILTAREDAGAPYARIEMVVEKKRLLPLQLKYFDEDGVHLKTERRLTYQCIKLVCTPEVVVMVDHSRDNATTRLMRRTWVPNPDLPDAMFTLADLAK